MAQMQWLGHASIKLVGSKKIYIDPFKLAHNDKADIILVTHSHFDHCSPEDIARLIYTDTEILATPDCEPELKELCKKIHLAEPNKTYEIQGIKIKTIPAYNPDKQFHPRQNNWVGYIVEMDGESYYHAGDTDMIPEMEGLEVDFAILPVGGKYTMNPQEASEAFKTMKAKHAFPMHYGTIIGSSADAEIFKKLIE